MRWPAVIVLVLLAATALAFVRTQQQKLERGPIGRVAIDHVFSPVCGCETDDASIALRLRRAEIVTLEIVDSELERVRTLVRRERYEVGDHAWSWDGRDDDGRLLPDGTYRPRLTLASGARTFVLPNPIELDATAPRVAKISVRPRRFSPDGDSRRDVVVVRYAMSEPARALLSVDGRRVERTRFRPLEGRRIWNGKRRGRGLPAGRYEVSLAGEDAAGNVGGRAGPVAVRIRYVELGRPLIRTRARGRFRVRVRSDAPSFRWRFAGRTGVASTGYLVLRAPRAGRYALFVSVNRRSARARVVVTPRPPRRSPSRSPAARRAASTIPDSGQIR